jgi:hypothetical protein
MRISKTYIIFWQLAILLLFSACYNDSLSMEDSDEIIVEASIEGVKDSRAAKLTNSSLTTFGMFGFYGSAKRVNNVNYTKNATTGAWKSAKLVMWANGAMNFYGISPSYDISTSNLNQTMVYDNPSFTYSVPTNTNDQRDILYSSVLNLKKADKNGKIIFSYKPGMHYFSFTSKQTIGSDYKVFIKKIVLHVKKDAHVQLEVLVINAWMDIIKLISIAKNVWKTVQFVRMEIHVQNAFLSDIF